MVWTRVTYRDGFAVCEDVFYTAWRNKECGEYEVRHLRGTKNGGAVSYAKVKQTWTKLPIHWEII